MSVNKFKKIKKNIKTKYISYNMRLIILSISLLLCFSFSLILINKSVIKKEVEMLKYSEKVDVDYLVYLKENEFYEEPFLESGMNYVASLIDHISVFFDYNFKASEKIDAIFYYDIDAELAIKDAKGEKKILSKEYNLINNKVITNDATNSISISGQSVDIDYNYYNEIAQKFKKSYNIDSISELIVTMSIRKMTDIDFDGFDQVKKISLTIPLTQKAINIKLIPSENNDNTKIINTGGYQIINKTFLGLSILLMLLSLFIIFRIFKLLLLILPKKTKLDKKVNKILKTYDRLIANVTTFPNLKEYKVVKVTDFNELVDIRDNLKRPIFYYNVKKGEKCHFYITDENTIYLLTMKDVDLNNENKK